MKILRRLIATFTRRKTTVPAAPSGEPLFVYVKMRGQLEPFDRQDLYEDPLDAALHAAGLGEVSGGGTAISAEANGNRDIRFCGIDVELTDADAGLALLRRTLVELGVPSDTVLQYRRAGNEHEVRVHEP